MMTSIASSHIQDDVQKTKGHNIHFLVLFQFFVFLNGTYKKFGQY